VKINKVVLMSLVALILVSISTYLYANAHKSKPEKNNPQIKEFTFKELGLKVSLASSLEGLTYEASDQKAKPAPPLMLRLKIKSFTDMANTCLGVPSNNYQNFATIIKQPGDYRASPTHVGDVIRQFNGYYLSDVGSSLPKDYKCKDSQTQTSLKSLQADLNKALIQTFDSAQPVSGH